VTESDMPMNETNIPETGQPFDVPAGEAFTQTAPEGVEAAAPVAGGKPVWGTGRRKCAVARVRLLPGTGKFTINKRTVEQYFVDPQDRNAALDSLLVTNAEKSYDVYVTVQGGGHTGQAGAIRLGVARALLKANGRHEAILREKGFLTRDARIVERKKYGQRKARRRFQFSKR
jgi:small subunit ribosomal protein S9